MAFRSSLFPCPRPCFPDSYETGCRQWRKALAAVDAEVRAEDFAYPAGAGLVTQTAHIGEPEAAATVVVIGGTHGVEGFAGTAIQTDLLELLGRGGLTLPAGLSLLFVNALNPWGYHYLHRHDHRGIDVNRNFVDFAAPPENPGYLEIQPLLGLVDGDARRRALAQAARAMGERAYEVAFSGGQYLDPAGPFFGGTEKSHSRVVIEALMETFDLPRRRLAVIDIHTGLGPYGHGEVICDHPVDSPGLRLGRVWYGPACTCAEDGSSSSVPKSGLLDYAWHRIMDGRGCFVTLEFGTLGTASLFEVLLNDTAGDGALTDYGSEALRNHFCPADPYWREAVVFRGRQVFFQALAGVSTQ